jgi:sugar porter (SP) family MFS transporter
MCEQVYVAEAADQSLRGMLVTGTSIFVSLGILLVYLFGSVLPQDWRGVAGVCAVFPVISAVAIWLLPESPVWLANRGRALEAENSLRRLRGVELPRQEVEALLDRGDSSVRAAHLSTVLRPEVWKPLLILNTFFLFQQISGVFVVIFYAVDIADDAGVHTDGHLVSVLIGATRLLVTVAISYASKRFGRRPLAVVSGLGMTLCMGTLSGCVYLESPALNWLPAPTLVLYIFMSTVGFLTLPWAMIGELFPTRVRGLAGGITTCCAYLFSFAVLKTYPEMKDTLGRQGVFLFYGVTALVGTVFLWLCLPETQGKTLEEVEQMFYRKQHVNGRGLCVSV